MSQALAKFVESVTSTLTALAFQVSSQRQESERLVAVAKEEAKTRSRAKQSLPHVFAPPLARFHRLRRVAMPKCAPRTRAWQSRVGVPLALIKWQPPRLRASRRTKAISRNPVNTR